MHRLALIAPGMAFIVRWAIAPASTSEAHTAMMDGRRGQGCMMTRGGSRGFTLMELLVAIGIIIILAGIMFPVVMHMKGKARQSECMSNIRQLAQAALIYAQDNDGFLPPWTNRAPEPPWASTNTGYPAPDRLHSSLVPYVKDNRVWYCPTDPYSGRDISRWSVYHLYSSYDFCMQIDPPLQLEGWTHKTGRISIQASSCPIVQDANVWSGRQGMEGLDPSLTGLGCQHFDGINVAYLDGHAKWRGIPR